MVLTFLTLFLSFRKHDYENFLCTLLLPNTKVREGIFVVRAFNAEIAMIRDQVSRQELGVARLLFWRNALHQAFRGEESTETFALSNPVVNELSQVSHSCADCVRIL